MAPRDGSNIYSQPFPDVVEDTTIESTVYNGFTNDVAQDLNAPRPIVAGGTGATNADQALVNLGGEKAAMLVTNYDSFVWQAGSFYSAAGATGAPNAHAFSGICYGSDAAATPPANQNVVLEARDATDDKLYVRRKTAGVWGAWVADIAAIEADIDAVEAAVDALEADKVAKAGDTMSGDLIVNATIQTSPTASAGTLKFGTSGTKTLHYDGTSFNLSGGPLLVANRVAADGYNARTGSSGSTGANVFNVSWGTTANLWIDTVDKGQIWTGIVAPVSLATNGYQKLPSGLIIQWGAVVSGGDPIGITFPTTFPSFCLNFQMTMNASGLTSAQSVTSHVSAISTTGATVGCRFINNGGAVGVASQGFYWFATGF